MNGAPNETRTPSRRFASPSLLTITLPESPYIYIYIYIYMKKQNVQRMYLSSEYFVFHIFIFIYCQILPEEGRRMHQLKCEFNNKDADN